MALSGTAASLGPMTQWGAEDERTFLDATVPLAEAVLAAADPWDVYEAGMALDNAASRAMSSGLMEGEYIPALPSTVFLIWARLTDEMDAPWAGQTPEHHAQAVGRMKRAASEWLACLRSPDARAEYLTRWEEKAAGDPPPLA